MLKVRKSLLLLFLMLLPFVVIGCNKDTTTTTTTGTTTTTTTTTTSSTTNGDSVAPVITVTNDHVVIEIDTTFNPSSYISVTDNVSTTVNITIVVSDWGTFDQSVEGTYTLTIKATDEAGNFSTATITVQVKADILAPMITGSVSQLSQLAGETLDLTKGLTGVDNVDGTNVIFTVSSLGDYDADVPGTYVVQITVSDAAGNISAPFNRTIVVQAAFTRAEMTSFEGEIIRFQAVYNPQIFNGNTNTGYNSAYNGDSVNVLTKEYLEWVLEYAPERLGSGVGWSIIAVTNSDDEIVYVRHWNSGEAYFTDGLVTSVSSVDWSTGTNRNWSETIGELVIQRTNARFSSGEMGLMMANLLQWVPNGGNVFIFLNWTALDDSGAALALKPNATDMSRSMGANYIMNSDEDGDEIRDYALGRTLQILNPELSDQSIRDTFDPANPFPIITIPGARFVTNTGIWKIQYSQIIYLDRLTLENSYDPLYGITANDGLGTDITGQITFKIYNYMTNKIAYGLEPSYPVTDPIWADYVENPWSLSANEVTLESVLNPANNGYYFVVEYQVTANGHTDTAYRLIQIASTSPDYIELYGTTDTLYSKAMGFEQRLTMNPQLVEFGPFSQTEKGMIFESSYYASLITKPILTSGVAVVINEYNEIQTIRFLNGTPFEMDWHGIIATEGLLWDATDLLSNIIVPDGGYLIVYPQGLNDVVLNKALRAFYDYDYAGGEITTPAPVNGIVIVSLPIKEVQEVSTLTLDGVTQTVLINSVSVNVEVISNSKNALIHSSALGGAGFRHVSGKVYYYDKDMYAALSQDSEVVDSFTTLANNMGITWMNNGVIIIFDENGNFYSARLGVGAAAEVHADGTFLFGAAINNWDVTVYDQTKVRGMLANILSDIPDGGSFMIFPNTSTSEIRNLAISLIWNATYPGGGAIVDVNADPVPANAATLGFNATTVTTEYLSGLDFGINYVATIVDKPAKIARPNTSIENNVLSWDNNVLAGSYDLYIDGVLTMENVGTLSDDLLTYSLDLSELSVADGTYDIQLRAITADTAVSATSVLSNPISFTVERLSDPTNFVRTDNILSWDAVEDATSYFVSINEGDFFEVTTNEVVIPDADIINGVVIAVYATGSTTKFDSLIVEYTLDVEVIPMEIILGQYTLPVHEFTVNSWMRYITDGDIGGQWIEALIVINGAEGILNLADETTLFAGGYALVLGTDNQIKYIVDRWGHEWNPTDGWTTNAGGWPYGASLKVSYFRPYLSEGDRLVMASQYTTGLEVGTWRNIFGNAVIFDLGILTTDHRAVDLLNAIDPTTVTVLIQEKVLTTSISLGTNDLNLVQFDLPTWLNYIDPAGSNDIGAAGIHGLVLVNGAFGITLLDDTTSIFAGGYAAILDENLNIKYIVDRWGHEWNPTDGWTTNAGGWVYGATLKASYFKPFLADGDMLLLASQYAGGLPAGNYRNYFGNALIKDLGTVTTDHRAVDLLTAINPAGVTITITQATSVFRVGTTLFAYKEFTFDEWMNYADPLGSNDIGAAGIPGIVVVSDLSTLGNYDDTAKVFDGGYLILLGSDFSVKYMVDRWGNEWNATAGWSVNPGGWTYGAKDYVSYFRSYVAEGDILILGGQYTNGSAIGASYRDLLGNQVFYNLGAAIYTGDHRAVLIADAIDPTTVVFAVVPLE